MGDTIMTVLLKDTKLTAKQTKAIRRKVEAILTGKASGGAEGQDTVCVGAPITPVTSVSYCVTPSTGTATGSK